MQEPPNVAIAELSPGVQNALQDLRLAFMRPGARTRIERTLRQHLPVFAALQDEEQLDWPTIAKVLGDLGIRTARGQKLRADVVRAQVGRARRAKPANAAKGQAQSRGGASGPRIALPSASDATAILHRPTRASAEIARPVLTSTSERNPRALHKKIDAIFED